MRVPPRSAVIDLTQLPIGLSEFALWHPEPGSAAPARDAPDVGRRLAEAGFVAFETSVPERAREAGLAATGLARVQTVESVHETARRHRDLGYTCTVLHVGSGQEDDEAARDLLVAVVQAGQADGHPLYVETHRATVTQDPWRTLRFAEALPELAFNCDFSHWYTGSELTYGDLHAKIERLRPVFERCRYVHGRLSTPGCIQITVEEARRDGHLAVFEQVWGMVFDAARRDGRGPPPFVVELLPAQFNYARRVAGPDGALREEGDRWSEALALAGIARELWRRTSPASAAPPSTARG